MREVMHYGARAENSAERVVLAPRLQDHLTVVTDGMVNGRAERLRGVGHRTHHARRPP